MFKSILFLAATGFASSVRGQITLANFAGVDWTGPFIEGQNYTFQWTIGNGQPVSASLWSGNYSQPIFAGVSATSNFIYTIPDPIAEGTYSIRLSQGGNQSDVSPLFSIFMAPLNTSASATVTVAAATGTGIAGSTTYIYFDEHCGCTKTGLVPAATGNSMLANYTAPAMTTPALATYTGAATDLRTAWLPIVLVGAAIVALLA